MLGLKHEIGGVTPFLDNMSDSEMLAWLGTYPKMDAWDQEQVITSLVRRLSQAEDYRKQHGALPDECPKCGAPIN